MSCFQMILVAGLLITPATTPPDKVSKSDLQLFQGDWKPAFILNDDGQPAKADELEKTSLNVEGSKFTLKGPGYKVTGRFTIDPTKSPKTIDIVIDPNGDKKPVRMLGIYRIDGESRKSCFALPDMPRPVRFPESPKGFVQFEWKRPLGD